MKEFISEDRNVDQEYKFDQLDGGLNNIGLNCSKDLFSDLSQIQGEIIKDKLVLENLSIHSDTNIRQILSLLEKNDCQKIDISQLNSNEKNLIELQISENYPLLKVLRITPDCHVVNVMFQGIKEMNKSLGHANVDKIIDELKDLIKQKLGLKNTGEGRTIGHDYKTISFSINQNAWDDAKKVLKNSMSIKKELLERLEDRGVLEDIAVCINKAPNQIKEIIQDSLDLCAGSSYFPSLEENDDLKELKQAYKKYKKSGSVNQEIIGKARRFVDIKLEYFYESQIASKIGFMENQKKNSDSNEIHEFDIDEIYENADQLYNFEKNLLEQYDGQSFEFDGVEYPIVIMEDGEKVFSPILLRYIRKYGDQNQMWDDSDQMLRKNLCKYFDKLNSTFDFISPIANRKIDIDQAIDLDRQIENNEVDVDALRHTYKKCLNKQEFYTQIDSQDGIQMFIDVKDMGIMNLQTGRDIMKDLVEKYDKQDIQNMSYHQLGLTNYGQDVTEKFLSLIQQIYKTYPNVKINLGGDEIRLFVPGKGKQAKKEITNILSNQDMTFRLAYSTNGEKSIAKSDQYLEKQAGISKWFEKSLEQVLYSENVDIPYDFVQEKWDFINIDMDIEKNFDKNQLIRNLDFDSFVKALGEDIEKIEPSYFDIEINGKRYTIGIDGRYKYNYDKRKFEVKNLKISID